MKRLLLNIIFFTFSAIFASGGEVTQETQKNHRIFIDPEISICLMGKNQNQFERWESEGQQYGIRMGYEFFNPQSVYVAISSTNSFGNVQTIIEDHNQNVDYYERGASRNSLEGNVGFTMQLDDISFAPFSGLGVSRWKDNGYSSTIAYIPLGITAQYAIIKDVFHIGLKCERLQYFHVWNRTPLSKHSGNILSEGAYGYEVSIPFSFFIESDRKKGNLCIEPYFLNLYDNLSLIGARFSTVHKF